MLRITRAEQAPFHRAYITGLTARCGGGLGDCRLGELPRNPRQFDLPQFRLLKGETAPGPEYQSTYPFLPLGNTYVVFFEEAMSEPESTEAYVLALAQRLGVRYEKTPDDELAEVITRLSGDEVVSDDIENLIVALKRAGLISGAEMVDLLSRYLTGKWSSGSWTCQTPISSQANKGRE
ncbi:hypothetical protein [Marinobacter sp. ATCH36]|uniref:hypothetical protein n=1 Tax=Marinobacter sp. ATCH36 TaxID=2945106 RepID=UPI002020E44F|nr:hypothetical protein [Marinobacter sp. ATCH36]MCL7942924.1 hypothetical protein [Marinobacter sp. ATCH36]